LTEKLVPVNDFKVPFLLQDACLIIIIIISIFFLDIKITKPEKKLSFKEEFSWLLNPAPLGFLILCFMFGISVGSFNTYVFVFAQEDLGASTSFLGYMDFAASLSALLILPFSKYILKFIGLINTICLSMILYIGRFIGYGLTYQTPPYAFIGLAAMEFLVALYFVAQIDYCSVIAPRSLIATAISLVSVLTWIVGQGLGSLLAGVLVVKYNMRDMFILYGAGISSFFAVYWLLYHLIIKKYEINQNLSSKIEGIDDTGEPLQNQQNSALKLSTRMISTKL